jgi:hypothetical protein
LVFIFVCVAALMQIASPALTVNDNPIVTARPVTRIGDEWFLPLFPIAEALGADIQITGDPPQLNIRRSDGTAVTFDSRSGEIRSRVVLVGRVKGYEQVQIVGPTDGLLFPLSGVVALLGVDIYEDRGRNLLVIQSPDGGRARSRTGGSILNVGTIDYNYGLTTNGANYAEFANVRSQILAGNVRTTEDLIMSGQQGASSPRMIQGRLRADFSPARAAVIGDQSTYSGVEAFTNAARAIDFETQFRGLFSSFYAGRAVGSSFATVGPVNILKYDTTLAGFGFRRPWRDKEFVLAGNHFRGPQRKGTALGVAYRMGNRTDQFRIQSSFGRFSSSTSQAWRPAFGATVTNTFNPARYLSITGQVDRYDKNFLTVRDESRFTGQFNKTGSVVLRPSPLLSLNGSLSDRGFLQTGNRSRNFSYGGNGSVPGARTVQWTVFRSVQRDDLSPAGRYVLQQFSISAPALNTYSFYAAYSRIQLGKDLVRDVNLVLLKDTRRYGRFGFHDQTQLGAMKRFGVDWTLQSATRDGFFRAGIDRSRNVNQTASLAPSLGMKLPIFRGNSILFTFTRDGHSKMLQVEFGGHMNRRHEVVSDSSSRPVVIARARITGRVYQDADFNGQFDARVDAPLPDLAVWLDDDKVVRTDAQGMFRFDDVAANAHRLRVSLETVPADLVFADLAERTTAVAPYGDSVVNFRVVKAGRIAGRVTYADNTPATDIRIVATGDRDTFSELNGNFLLSDLPPGAYELRVDTQTIPPSYVPKPAIVRVEVKPGKASEGIGFQLVVPPRPVIEKELPIQQGVPFQ